MKKMGDTLNTIATGVLGTAGIEIAPVAAEAVAQSDPTNAIIQLALQVVIGIVTLWKLIKKPKPTK